MNHFSRVLTGGCRAITRIPAVSFSTQEEEGEVVNRSEVIYSCNSDPLGSSGLFDDDDDGKWPKDFINARVEEDNESMTSRSAHVSRIWSRLPEIAWKNGCYSIRKEFKPLCYLHDRMRLRLPLTSDGPSALYPTVLRPNRALAAVPHHRGLIGAENGPGCPLRSDSRSHFVPRKSMVVLPSMVVAPSTVIIIRLLHHLLYLCLSPLPYIPPWLQLLYISPHCDRS